MEPNLSLCLLTGDPVATAGRIAVLRPYVDEIVVAVDARAADSVDVLHDADRCLVYDFAFPSSRNFAWLNAQCTGRWRLRLDADEVPGRGLLENLADLTRADDVTHYWLPRRWLYGDARTWLTGLPWYPDYQLRLVRNLPAVDHPPRRAHDLAPVAGPSRYLDTPIYHFDLIEQPLAVRAEKAAGYERTQAGLRTEGIALNAGFYLPEQRTRLATAPVPDEDRSVLAASEQRATRPRSAARGPEVIRVGRDAIDACWPGRTLPESAYRVRIEPFGPVPALDPDGFRNLYVHVTNTGDETWPGEALHPEIRVGYRFTAADGRVHDTGGRALLPGPLPPGSASVVPVPVRAPSEPGPWRIEVDLVHEHVRWFGQPLVVDVTVHAAPRVALIAGDSPFRHVGDDSIVRAHLQQLALFAPEAEAVLLTGDPGAAAAAFAVRAEPDLYRAVYDGIDDRREPDEIASAVRTRIEALVEAATRQVAGETAGDPVLADAFRVLTGCSALIVAAGGALTSAFAIPALWPQCAAVLVARALGVPVVFSGVTVGPFVDRDRSLVTAAFAAADLVVVRDATDSPAELDRLGTDPGRIVVAPDPAVAALPAPTAEVDAVLTASGLADHPYAIVSLRDRATVPESAAVAALVDHLAARGIACLAVPHCVHPSEDDRRAHSGVAERAPALLTVEPLPPDDVIAGLAARAALVIGSRYHLAVFAAAAGVPALALVDGPYTERKARGAGLAGPGPVTPLPVDASADELIAAADVALAAPIEAAADRIPMLAPTLPAVARIVADLRSGGH